MRKLLILGAAVVALSAAPVFANVVPVIDWTAIGKQAQQITHEVTMIQNQATQIRGQITWLRDSAQNLAKLPNSFQDAAAKVDSISTIGAVADAVNAEARGTFAAKKILADSSYDTAETNRLNGMASRANGAQQQAQAMNGYLSQQSVLLEKANALAAQAQMQHAAETRAPGQAMSDSGGILGAAGTVSAPNNL
jgi:hypothetical protein